ncbi:MAG: hypothetical protein GWN99_11395 [Gemmatimonadetes bacterium]|uniref:Peptidase C39 domain-containing protein n=1 Tax=Candidatus Kutchimonas denitrificans TaxID=3056748 RepID=A0AAE5CB46_9BACT|nr:hypothetical protein [Gemmatimonadota bacterium]NIR74088.1 hypothetical protein [Candidatus Kutchimonas denitrificans]NIS01650.1 hypothetical protein [Gemmatimonadota bacterium]NIT67388.1 hypothetical protein [Gemmatimonadota bacterium]NIU52751.1 hypothetical protein [Gemmatimonadota bacterium]
MGIYKQPGKWECGPFALKHALLMRGILASEWKIGRLAGTSPAGTNEVQLARAAAHYGCEFPTVRRTDPGAAREELARHLREGVACLLCVDEWDHWVAAVNEEEDRFIILDSEKLEVIVVLDWPRLRKWWVYHDDGATLYDLHPVIPPDTQRTRARFTLERARHLLDPANRSLAQLWDIYVEDLIALCGSPQPAAADARSFGEFLNENADLLLDQLETWHGKVDRDAAVVVLDRMRFVADTYGLSVQPDGERRTISALSVMLALWCAGEFGVAPLYRKVPVHKIR